MDTGMGPDSYSVIELKMVESLLSGKNEDRKGLLEEAALKITLSIESDRSTDVLCSPNTHLIASTTFDFPQPFGPTTAVTPFENLILVLLANDLKP